MRHTEVIHEHEKIFDAIGERVHDIEQAVVDVKVKEISPMKETIAAMKKDMEWIKWGVMFILIGTVGKILIDIWIK